MQIKVKTLNPDGSIAFEGVLGQHEVQFVLEVGVNFLMANGASPFIEDGEEEDDDLAIEVEGVTTLQ